MALAHPLPFGAALKRERLARGLTQEALAERAGLSTHAISDLERGVNRAPRKETLRRLADALQLSAEGHAHLEAASRWSTTAPAAPAAPVSWVSSDSARPPLAGRAHERARLAQHLAGAGPPLLLLSGEPGIGKSRLLEEASQQASRHGWTVLAGGCHRQSMREPYSPLLGALADYLHRQPLAQRRVALDGCAWLVRLLPELAEQGLLPHAPWTLPPPQERRLMFGAAERLLRNVAGHAGTVLVLDDLQWAGADALALLGTLMRAAERMSLRVLGSYRSTDLRAAEPLAALVADLAAAGLAAQLDLAPLAPAEARALLADLLEPTAGEESALAEQIVRRAGGVPFFLVSCAQAVRQQPGTAAVVPWTVTQSIRQRVAILPEGARDLLGAAAVIGRRIPRALVQAVALQPEHEALAALESACHARLLAEEEEGYRFPHDLIREVIVGDLSAGRRRLLHRLVAEALEERSGEPLARLASHWVGAGECQKAAAVLEQAGDQAQAMHAFVQAEGYYRDGLAQLDHLGRGRVQERARLHEKLGNALTFQDRYDDAMAVFTQAEQGYRATGDREGQWRTLAQIGWVHGNRGTFHEGLSQLEPLLERPEPGLASSGLAALSAALAFLAFGSSDYRQQLAFAQLAVRLAQPQRDDPLLIQAQHMVSVALSMLGNVRDSVPPLMETIYLAERVGDLWKLSEALNALSSWYLRRGDFDQGQAAVERAYQAAEQLGWPTHLAYLSFWRGQVAFTRGEWTEAQAYYAQALALGRESGGLWGMGYPAYGRGHLALVRGESEATSGYLAAATALAEHSHDLRLLRPIQRALAEVDLLAGHPEAARARLAPLRDQPGQEELSVTLCLPFLAWAALDSGESAEAEALLSACLRRARDQEARIVVPDALRIQARLAGQRGLWAEAEAALDEALAVSRSMHYPYAEAKALYDYGHLRLQQGMVQQGREHLETALALCDRLGERLYARQIEATLVGLKEDC